MIAEKVQERLGDGFEVSFDKVEKNNGITLDAIQIKKQGEELAPVIFVDPTKDTEDEIVEDILEKYKSDAIPGSYHARRISEIMMSKEQILERVVPIAINLHSNWSVIQKYVYRGTMDLAFIYGVIEGDLCVKITNEHAAALNLTESELYAAGARNAGKVAQIQTTVDILRDEGLLGSTAIGDFMSVVSNEQRFYGAGLIFMESVAKQTFLQMAVSIGESLVVIPSSVHETLILKKEPEMDVDTLRQMIIDTNTEIVDPMDILSNNPYLIKRTDSGVAISIWE